MRLLRLWLSRRIALAGLLVGMGVLVGTGLPATPLRAMPVQDPGKKAPPKEEEEEEPPSKPGKRIPVEDPTKPPPSDPPATPPSKPPESPPANPPASPPASPPSSPPGNPPAPPPAAPPPGMPGVPTPATPGAIDPNAPGGGAPAMPAFPGTPPGSPPAFPGTPPETPSVTPPPEEEQTTPESEVTEDGVFVFPIDELKRAAETATHPELKSLYNNFAVAYDRLTEVTRRQLRITPLPLNWQNTRYPEKFGIAEFDAENQVKEPREVVRKLVSDVECFELLALAAVTQLLDAKTPTKSGTPELKPGEKLAAGEKVLAAVYFFHDAARNRNRRKGKGWDPVKTTLYDKLTEIRVAQIRQAGADQDWTQLRSLAAKLISIYKANPRVLEQIYAARLLEGEYLVKSTQLTDLERSRELLNEYDARFPNTGNESAQRIRSALAAKAKQFLADAQRMAAQNQGDARNLLKAVEGIDPDNPNLRGMQQELKSGYPILYVGARRLPERMSPARARWDSEKQAVELLFEGLLEPLPDDIAGVTYRPALAAVRPAATGGVRDVELVRSADWGGEDRGIFDVSDVVGTIRLFRQSPTSWAADPADWLDDPGFDPSDPGRVRLRFKQGHVDPRGLLTLKLHPARWLLEKNKRIDDLDFALKPFGTGPFRLAPNYQPPRPGEPSQQMVFVANPSYARRPARMGQPFIKEIRFVDLNRITEPVTEFRGDRLHILTDVPTSDLPKYEANNGLNGRVRVATAATNMRVHFLAINHRRPALQNSDLRKGISQAIDREKILNEVFRSGRDQFHKSMTGPFPPGTWAVPRPLGAAPPPLYSRELAEQRLRQALTTPTATGSLNLSFANDDVQARAACERIKAMVEAAAQAAGHPLTIQLEPLAPAELHRRVVEEPRYDLAYLPFDYPDAWFPLGLGSFLDPGAIGGRNYLGYLGRESNPSPTDDELGRLLAACRAHRDFSGELVKRSHEIHRKFNEVMPFVPLWQLDRHMVFSTAVKIRIDGRPEELSPRILDATTLFTSIGRWQVE